MRKLLLFQLLLLLLFSCKNREAATPAYITINAFTIETDYSTEYTASSKITTVWVEANDEYIGVFELPIRFPIIANGPTKLRITPGINLNGSLSLRNIYDAYTVFEQTLDLYPGDEIELKSNGKDHIVTGYNPNASIILIEDFEGAGINFKPTLKSDTTLLRTSDSTLVFSEPGLNELNEKSGMVIMPEGNAVVEYESLQTFELLGFNTNIYLEVNYRCDVPVTFGVFANETSQRVQAPVVTVNPTDEWKKIYINLVTEVSGNPDAVDFNIFFGAINTDNSHPEIFVDNLKLVY